MKKKDGFTVAIIRVSDGRMAIWHEDYDTTKHERDTAAFCWQEGNFACDCNRHTFFEEADGNGDNADHIQCSHGLYVVPVLVWDDDEMTRVDDAMKEECIKAYEAIKSIKSGLLSAQ